MVFVLSIVGMLIAKGTLAADHPRDSFLPADDAVPTDDTGKNVPGELHFTAQKARFHVASYRLNLNHFTASVAWPDGTLRLAGEAADCNGVRCHLRQITLIPCPHDLSGISVVAETMRVQRDEMVLSSPRIRFGDTNVFGLPWLKLVSNRHSGLLAPDVGWSTVSGLRVGSGVYMPISRERNLTARAAARFPTGMDSSLTVAGNRGWGELSQLRYDSRNMVAVQSRGTAYPGAAVVAVDSHMVSDREIIDQLLSDPRQRAVNGTNSLFRLGVINDIGGVENQLRYSQPFVDDGRMVHVGQLHLGADLYPTDLPGIYVEPSFSATLDRFVFDWDDAITDQTRLSLAPAFKVPLTILYTLVTVELGALAERRQVDETGRGNSRLLPSMLVTASLPLMKSGHRTVHMMTPAIAFRMAPYQYGVRPPVILDAADARTTGYQMDLSLENRFGADLGSPDFTLVPLLQWRRVDDGGENEASIWYISLFGAIEKKWASVLMDASANVRTRKLNTAKLTVDVGRDDAMGFAAAYFYGARGARPEVAIGAAPIDLWPLKSDHMERAYSVLMPQMHLSFSQRIQLRVDTQFNLYPGIALSALIYELEFATSCRCLVASLRAAHRPDRYAPDVMLHVTWNPR
jgi:hypothetical protein